MPFPTYEVVVDRNQNASYADAGEDVTADVRAVPGFTTVRGLDLARPLTPPMAGIASYELDNTGATPTYQIGAISKGDPTRIRATYSAVTYDLFEGLVSDAVQHPEASRQSVGVGAYGVLQQLVGKKVSTALLTNATTDTCITALLDAAGFSATDRVLGTGQTTLTYWWLDEEDAFAALVTLLNTEGPFATIYENGNDIVFQNRHARVTESRSTASQATFRGATTEPIFSAFDYDDGLRNVVNVCTVDVVTRSAAALAAIWSLGYDVVLGASEVRTYVVRTSSGDPFTGALDPVAGTDYTLAAGTLASGTLNRTSGGNATLTLTAGAGGATLTGLQVRAQAVEVTTRTKITNSVNTSASQTANGVQTYNLDVRPDIAPAFAQAFCDFVVTTLQDGRPNVTITITNKHDTGLVQALSRQISDRITVIETRSGLNDQFWIDAISHRVAQRFHQTTFGCEEATDTAFAIWDGTPGATYGWDAGSWVL